MTFEPTDESLYFSYVNGSEEDFCTLYQRYRLVLWSMVVSRVRNKDIADEIVQDVFFKIHATKERYKAGTNLKALIFKITWNAVNDFFRARKRRAMSVGLDFDDEIPKEFIIKSDTEDIAEKKSEVIRVLAGMKDEHQDLLRMYAFDGFSHKQIAAILKLPEVTARSKVHRAIKAFGKVWRRRNFGLGRF